MAAQNEKLRVVVVGGVAGGASAAARVKRLNENADVVVFEKGSDVSFSNCGLPYYLSGTVEDSEDLIMMTPAAFRKKHDIDVRVHSEVVSIDREKKTVTVRSTETGEIALMRTPLPPFSLAAFFVRWMMAALLAP